MIEALRNAFRLPDLRRKLLYTLLILVIYQFAAHVTVPGVDRGALDELFKGDAGRLFERAQPAVGWRGLQLQRDRQRRVSLHHRLDHPATAGSDHPALEAIAKEPGGQEKINRYTYYLAIPMAALQAIGQINIFQSQVNQSGRNDADSRLWVWQRQRSADDALGHRDHDRRHDVRHLAG